MSEGKIRLDKLVLEKYPELSRRKIQDAIASGSVSVNGVVLTKSGGLVLRDALIEINITGVDELKYVSRAGLKLAHALEQFNLVITNYCALDAGLSTGGFTDCLLQHGAERVYGVDVGVDQVIDKIKHDDRVIVMEGVNIRELAELPEQVDICTLDLSFISLTKIIPNITKFIKSGGYLVTLIKPQFEAGKEFIRRGGVVNDVTVHERVCSDIVSLCQELDMEQVGDVIPSPISGASGGNKEFLACFKKV